MTRDDILESLRRAVLENPDEDTVRWVYADRLDELGCHDEANMIRRQLEDPQLTHTVAGAKIGLRLIDTVTYRRGFVDEVTVALELLRHLGDVVRDHPVALVRVEVIGVVVEAIGLVVRIAFGAPAPAGPGRGRRGRHPLRWGVEVRADRPSWECVPPSTYYWNSREQMVRRIGPVVADFVARMFLEVEDYALWGNEQIQTDRLFGYRAGEAWADSRATRQQLRLLDRPVPDNEVWAWELQPPERLYFWVFRRLGSEATIEAFWATVVGDEADEEVVDSDAFVFGFRLGALSRRGQRRRARSGRPRVVPPPGP
jgi:uncharacterized protein (TIGR02996 family)